MSQSVSCVLTHIIFSTKNRAPFLTPEIQPDLFAYLATVARNLGCECYRVGGVEDHVHLALRLSRIETMAHLVQELKRTSSIWLKKQSPTFSNFAWQHGYGIFSIGRSDLNALIRYIDNQSNHHKKYSFKEEYYNIVDKYGVDYDDRYLLD